MRIFYLCNPFHLNDSLHYQAKIEFFTKAFIYNFSYYYYYYFSNVEQLFDAIGYDLIL